MANEDIRTNLSAELVTITPSMAKSWLDSTMVQRPLRVRHAEQIKRDIENGKWVLNGDTIKITSNGSVVDGQHRLKAIVLSGIPVSSYVVYNIPLAAFPTINSPSPATYGDRITAQGIPNGRRISALIRKILQYELYGYFHMHNPCFSPTINELDEVRFRHDPTGGHELLKYLIYKKTINGALPESIISFAQYATFYAGGMDALDFWEGVFSGNSKSLTLRSLHELLVNAAIAKAKDKSSGLPIFCYTAKLIKGWNFYVAGKEVKNIIFKETDDMPVIFGFTPYDSKKIDRRISSN